MKRHFVKPDFKVTTWDLLKPYFDQLLEKKIGSKEELEQWLKDNSELGAVVSEDMAWRYIKMTCDTANKELRESFNDFIQNIEPNIAPISNELNKKLVADNYASFQKIILEDAPAIFLNSQLYFYVVSPKVRGIEVQNIALPSDRFNEINNWFMDTERVLK